MAFPTRQTQLMDATPAHGDLPSGTRLPTSLLGRFHPLPEQRPRPLSLGGVEASARTPQVRFGSLPSGSSPTPRGGKELAQPPGLGVSISLWPWRNCITSRDTGSPGPSFDFPAQTSYGGTRTNDCQPPPKRPLSTSSERVPTPPALGTAPLARRRGWNEPSGQVEGVRAVRLTSNPQEPPEQVTR